MTELSNEKSEILIVGASYGLLLTSLLQSKGFGVTIFCSDQEKKILTCSGINIVKSEFHKFNINNGVQISSHNFSVISDLNEAISSLSKIKLIFLAVSEIHLYSDSLTKLISSSNKLLIPKISFMNLPIPSFLMDRLNISPKVISDVYLNHNHLLELLPENLTMICNPEPQVFRPGHDFNTIQIRLGGTFRVCRSSSSYTNNIFDSFLTSFAKHEPTFDLPISLRAYESCFIGLSKLPMLMAGNYRCFNNQGDLISISEAVSNNVNLSQSIYESVILLLKKMGAKRSELIPFRLYYAVSSKLTAPSSVCRSIANGAASIERADKLIYSLMGLYNCDNTLIADIVHSVDSKLL